MSGIDHLIQSDRQFRLQLTSYLSDLVLERRLNLLREVLSRRTRYITVVLEDLYQPQNASAALRSCECLGIQDVHIIENRNSFNVNPEVDMGASKWLTIKKYSGNKSTTQEALQTLRSSGYRIVATSPHSLGCSIRDFDTEKGKFAILFGTELSGLSEEAMSLSEEFITIPMYGFTESYNISVSVAITLYELVHRAKANPAYPLSEYEKEVVLLDWLRKSVKNCHIVEKRFVAEYNKLH